MPNPQGKKPINLSSELVTKLSDYQKSHRYKSASLTAFVNELLEDVIDKDEMLKKLAPGLQIIGLDDNVLYIKDSKDNKNRFAEITLRNNRLHCNLDDEDDYCIHIRFAFAIPEIAKLNLKKPPTR